MIIKKATLQNFRNHRQVHLDSLGRFNVFLGPNGQGKTNLLEALALLCSGRSFREAKNLHFINQQAMPKQAQLEGEVETSQGRSFDLKVSILPGSRQHRLNKKLVPATRLSRYFPFVAFSPDSLSAIKGSADERRRLVDELVITTMPQGDAIRTELTKTLRQKNKTLRHHASGEWSRADALRVLHTINSLFLKTAVDLTMARLSAIKSIWPEYREVGHDLFGGPVDISVEYLVSGKNVLEWEAPALKQLMADRLEQLLPAELASSVSLSGPQKHEIIFNFQGRDSRFFCSQGQQRALILALKMAHVRWLSVSRGERPFLLLDDVFSELDEAKQRQLFGFLSQTEAQVFISATELSRCVDVEVGDMQIIRMPSAAVAVDPVVFL